MLQEECPAYPSNIAFNISKNEFQVIYTAQILAKFVTAEDLTSEESIEEQRKFYERYNVYRTRSDSALIAKTKGEAVCYATFAGTNSFSLVDLWQNINPLGIRIGDCAMKRGYYQAYAANHIDELRVEIDACVASCNDGCRLVLSGFSQGGSAAIAAAVDLRRYNPTTITFGAPPAFKEISDEAPCTDFNGEDHYWFINTKDSHWFLDQPIYDQVTVGGTYVAFSRGPPLAARFLEYRMMGMPLLLDDVNWPISYPDLNSDFVRYPASPQIHASQVYIDRIRALYDQGCYPIPVGKWMAGHYCNFDDECASGFCADEKCTPSL